MEQRWERRRGLAVGVRTLAWAVPLAGSVGSAVLVATVFPPPDGAAAAVWWVGLVGWSLLVLAAIDRVARRLLPLATLLSLSLVFPDRAPSRFRVALRAGSLGQLQRAASDARQGERCRDGGTAHVLSLATALSSHDRRTRGHCERVRAYAEVLGEELGLDDEEIDRLRWGALLHDIGKIRVAPAVLNKRGRLDDAEWALVRRHPEAGAKLIDPIKDWLGPWAGAVDQHHERFDGAGYPYGLSGDELSLGARIVAIADSFEVMTAARSYKKPMSAIDAREELVRCAGSHFDPTLVRAFVNVSLGRLRRIMGPVAVLVQLPVIGLLPRTALAAGNLIGGSAGTAASAPAAAAATLATAGLTAIVGGDLTPAPALGENAAPQVTVVGDDTTGDESPDDDTGDDDDNSGDAGAGDDTAGDDDTTGNDDGGDDSTGDDGDDDDTGGDDSTGNDDGDDEDDDDSTSDDDADDEGVNGDDEDDDDGEDGDDADDAEEDDDEDGPEGAPGPGNSGSAAGRR